LINENRGIDWLLAGHIQHTFNSFSWNDE